MIVYPTIPFRVGFASYWLQPILMAMIKVKSY